MLTYFIFFVLGAASLRALQFFLSVTPNYYIYKKAEYVCLQILMDLEVRKLTVLKVLKLSYDDTGDTEQYEKVKYAINEKYDKLITNCIDNLKTNLPYKVKYANLNEAAEYYISQIKGE